MPKSRKKTALDSTHYNIKPYHDAGLVNKAAELIKNHPSDSALSNNLSGYLQTPRRTKGEIVKQLFKDAIPFVVGLGILAAIVLIFTSDLIVMGLPLCIFLMAAGAVLWSGFLVVAAAYELGSYIHDLITSPDQERLQQEGKKLETSIQNVTASKDEIKSSIERKAIEGSVDEESNTAQLNLSGEKQSAIPLPFCNPHNNPHMHFSSSVASESANQESMAGENRVNHSLS